jgi:hypothetical protein
VPLPEEVPVGRDHILDVGWERVLRRQPVVQGDGGNPGSDHQASGEAERRPNPADRRSSQLALTRAGDLAVARAEPAWQAAIHESLGGTVTSAELSTLSRFLDALRSDLERSNLGLPAG